MISGQTIGVVIPTLNEAGAIGNVISDIPDWVDRTIVCDSGSTDATVEIARRLGAESIISSGEGYGAACLAGISELGSIDIIVFLDGDYSDYPEQMERLVRPITEGVFDLVIGSRRLGEAQAGSLTIQQRFGNWLACSLIRIFWKVNYTDLGPFRAVKRTALEQLDMTDRAFGWTVQMQLHAIFAGIRVTEVPVDYRCRIGHSKISGTLKGTILAGKAILGTIFRSAIIRKFEP